MTEPLATSRLAPAPNSHSAAPRKPLRRIVRDELPFDAVDLARFLIGTLFVRKSTIPGDEPTIVRVIETEAYPPGDAASHAFRGLTPRTASMFGERGIAYVYFIYGNHYCLNVSADRAGIGAGVLVRAAEPIAGDALMRVRSGECVATRDLLRGPGRLARALAVDRSFDGVDLCASGDLWLARARAGRETVRIACGTRIGLTKNAEAPLRFWEADSAWLSGPKNVRLASASV